jgi:sugar O-acyltransferase (sialic acid O-acetyltransferase NeuD family)
VTDRTWVVVGSGGHARSVVDVLLRRGATTFVFVGLESAPPSWAPGGSIAFAQDDLTPGRFDDALWVVAVGDNDLRQRLMQVVVPMDALAPAVVARTATVAPDAVLGRGVVVLEHAHVGPGANVGLGSIINTSAVVEHDSVVGEFAHIAPRAALLGGVRVGNRVLAGAACTILPMLRVGADARLGSGAVVTTDVGPNTTVVGIPGRPLTQL